MRPASSGADVVFLIATYGGSGRTSGAEVSDRRAYLYRVEGGKITRVQLFLAPESATRGRLAAGVVGSPNRLDCRP